MKVTDRRMFTSDGDLKQEYRHLEDAVPADPSVAEPPVAEPPVADDPTEEEAAEAEAEGPSILDLVRLLAENASVHLQQAEMPDGRQAENLDLAQLYVELLVVLQEKTSGNLTAREATMLDDVLYQLRLGYAERRGF